jgi:hypothetical protein
VLLYRLTFANVNGHFEKLVETYNKIKDKSGDFDIVFLIGKVFNKDLEFGSINLLSRVASKLYILDNSEVGNVFKHKAVLSYELLPNVVMLGRSGYVDIDDIRIAFLNGSECQKFMSSIDRFKYTGSAYTREDIDNLLNDREELKVDILLLNTVPGIIYDELIKYNTF